MMMLGAILLALISISPGGADKWYMGYIQPQDATRYNYGGEANVWHRLDAGALWSMAAWCDGAIDRMYVSSAYGNDNSFVKTNASLSGTFRSTPSGRKRENWRLRRPSPLDGLPQFDTLLDLKCTSSSRGHVAEDATFWASSLTSEYLYFPEFNWTDDLTKTFNHTLAVQWDRTLVEPRMLPIDSHGVVRTRGLNPAYAMPPSAYYTRLSSLASGVAVGNWQSYFRYGRNYSESAHEMLVPYVDLLRIKYHVPVDWEAAGLAQLRGSKRLDENLIAAYRQFLAPLDVLVQTTDIDGSPLWAPQSWNWNQAHHTRTAVFNCHSTNAVTWTVSPYSGPGSTILELTYNNDLKWTNSHTNDVTSSASSSIIDNPAFSVSSVACTTTGGTALFSARPEVTVDRQELIAKMGNCSLVEYSMEWILEGSNLVEVTLWDANNITHKIDTLYAKTEFLETLTVTGRADVVKSYNFGRTSYRPNKWWRSEPTFLPASSVKAELNLCSLMAWSYTIEDETPSGTTAAWTNELAGADWGVSNAYYRAKNDGVSKAARSDAWDRLSDSIDHNWKLVNDWGGDIMQRIYGFNPGDPYSVLDNMKAEVKKGWKAADHTELLLLGFDYDFVSSVSNVTETVTNGWMVSFNIDGAPVSLVINYDAPTNLVFSSSDIYTRDGDHFTVGGQARYGSGSTITIYLDVDGDLIHDPDGVGVWGDRTWLEYDYYYSYTYDYVFDYSTGEMTLFSSSGVLRDSGGAMFAEADKDLTVAASNGILIKPARPHNTSLPVPGGYLELYDGELYVGGNICRDDPVVLAMGFFDDILGYNGDSGRVSFQRNAYYGKQVEGRADMQHLLVIRPEFDLTVTGSD